jgi:hypothetical protein
MIRKITDSAASAPEASTPGVTLCVPTHMAAPSHALVLREGPRPTRPRGRIPRVARLLALAHHFDELLETGAVETQAELAELAKLTPARITQIMNLLDLAPDVQEEGRGQRGAGRGRARPAILAPTRRTDPTARSRHSFAASPANC